MGKPLSDLSARRKNLLYRDDALIDILVVIHRLGSLCEEPRISISVDRVAHFRADLELLYRIDSNHFPDHRHSGLQQNARFPEYLKECQFGSFDEPAPLLDELSHLEKDKGSLGTKAHAALKDLITRQYQEARLKSSQSAIYQMLTGYYSALYSPNGRITEFAQAIYDQLRDLVVGPMFSLDMGEAPHQGNPTRKFKKHLAEVLEAFKIREGPLFPLKRPISVILLYAPTGNQSADLDNLARLVIPAIHKIFRPPRALGETFQVKDIPDEKIREHFEAEASAMPRQPEHSVLSYEIIKAPELFGPSGTGGVRLVLGDGLNPVSWWKCVNGFVDKWGREVDDSAWDI